MLSKIGKQACPSDRKGIRTTLFCLFNRIALLVVQPKNTSYACSDYFLCPFRLLFISVKRLLRPQNAGSACAESSFFSTFPSKLPPFREVSFWNCCHDFAICLPFKGLPKSVRVFPFSLSVGCIWRILARVEIQFVILKIIGETSPGVSQGGLFPMFSLFIIRYIDFLLMYLVKLLYLLVE